MSETLPIGDFHFLNDEQLAKLDLSAVALDAEYGFIVECDMSYPAHLHNLHSDYPLAPEHLTVSRDMLSPFASQFVDKNWKSSKKLVPNLTNNMYVITEICSFTSNMVSSSQKFTVFWHFVRGSGSNRG